MGRCLDRIVLTVLTALALYLFFIGATEKILPSLALTFAAMLLLKKLAGRIPADTAAKRRKRAQAVLEQLALSEPPSAKAALGSLLDTAYPEKPADMPLEYVLRHPSAKTTAADIAEIYSRRRGTPSVAVVSLPPADVQAFALASRLQNPEIALVDGNMLAGIIAKHPDLIPSDDSILKKHVQESRFVRMGRAASNARSGKCALTGGSMCLLFLITGAPVYLIGGLILIYIACISLRKKRMPVNLFLL